jgi:hypothetical protein
MPVAGRQVDGDQVYLGVAVEGQHLDGQGLPATEDDEVPSAAGCDRDRVFEGGGWSDGWDDHGVEEFR